MKLQSVAVVASLLSALCARADETKLPPAQQLAHDIYAEIIAIDTTHSTGSTTRAADAIAKRLVAAGFPAGEIHRLGPTPTKGNLVVRLRGAADKKPLLLLAHLDVVEAKREDWTVDPFTLLERDGFFYGRGTLDDKAMAAILHGRGDPHEARRDHAEPRRDPRAHRRRRGWPRRRRRLAAA
jgi:hypothetical protein